MTRQTLELFTQELEAQPVSLVERVCNRFIRGQVDQVNPGFAPSLPEFLRALNGEPKTDDELNQWYRLRGLPPPLPAPQPEHKPGPAAPTDPEARSPATLALLARYGIRPDGVRTLGLHTPPAAPTPPTPQSEETAPSPALLKSLLHNSDEV